MEESSKSVSELAGEVKDVCGEIRKSFRATLSRDPALDALLKHKLSGFKEALLEAEKRDSQRTPED